MRLVLREFLRQTLPPKVFRRVLAAWRHRFYLPSLTVSIFVKRPPILSGFPSGRSSDLVSELRDVNVLAPTEMCRVMNRHGSDKGVGGRHNYTPIYSVLFGKLRASPLRIFELGLGSGNPAFAANMGAEGSPGGSLRGWKELFPNALIYGADIDRACLFEEDRIMTFYCDQLDRVAIDEMWSQPALQGGMDIIVEDGMHTFEGSVSFLNGSLRMLRPGGVYVIEDVPTRMISRWQEELETNYSKRYLNLDFAIVQLPISHNDRDNNLMIIRDRG